MHCSGDASPLATRRESRGFLCERSRRASGRPAFPSARWPHDVPAKEERTSAWPPISWFQGATTRLRESGRPARKQTARARQPRCPPRRWSPRGRHRRYPEAHTSPSSRATRFGYTRLAIFRRWVCSAVENRRRLRPRIRLPAMTRGDPE